MRTLVLLPLFGVTAIACVNRVGIERATPETTTPLPGYPEMMRAASAGGIVSLAVPVSEAGVPDPQRARVIESSHELLLLSVRRALSSWRFRPGRRNGTPYPDTALIRFTFALDSSARCGPADISVSADSPEPDLASQPPPSASFDSRTLSGIVSACRPTRLKRIAY